MFGGLKIKLYFCTKYTRMLMQKRILGCFLAMLAMSVSPLVSSAAEMELAVIEQAVEEQVSINVDQQTVTVGGAQGKTLEVVSLTGKKLVSVKIDSPSQRVELNISKGCYILKVGKVVRKITVR